jgi:hypothetical protein
VQVLLMLALLVASAQEPVKHADLTLVVERNAAGILVFTCNGKSLDPQNLDTGLLTMLGTVDQDHRRMFVLFDDRVSLDVTFQIGSLVETVVGLRDVRYFAFSRKTAVMQEIKPHWERWKLSLDGKLERKPFAASPR